jgi:hypothetical protein
MSNALATQDAAELAAREEALEALRAQQDSEMGDEPFQVPLLKVGEPLTKEVQDDNSPAQAGDFINTLTGDALGSKVEFIICYYHQGRFAVDRKTNNAFVAGSEDLIPETWKDFVGENFVGTRFDEYPDAEERYKERVNDGEIEWGKGPPVSTTHNYTGLVLVQERDEEDQPLDGVFELQPVRLSLKRTNMPAVRKINSLRRMSLRPPKDFWSRAFTLTTQKKQHTQGASHLVIPALGRTTTAEEQMAAFELAQAVAAGRVTDNQDAQPEKATAPDAKGGLSV